MSVITLPYKPFPLQAYLHDHLKRFNVIVCHRRFGKTIFAVNEMIKKAMTLDKQKPQFAYIAPTQKQAKLIAWDAFKTFSRVIPDIKFNESELKITLPNEAKIFVLGAENPDNLRGLYLDGVVLDEVAQMPHALWSEVIRPTLSDRQGWAIFIGTPKGQNEFYRLFLRAKTEKNWYSAVFKLSDTTGPDKQLTLMTHEEAKLAKKEYKGREEIFEQEYECSFTAAIRGTYYTKVIGQMATNNQLTSVPYDPDYPVITAWDIGINDKTCIWYAQQMGGEIRIIDYDENTGESLNFYASIVKSKPYTYDYHILPHDVNVRSLATGKTRKEHLQNLGLKIQVAPKLPVDDGINAVRTMLPKCFFDVKKCDKGLKSLMNYRSDYDSRTGTFKKNPLHDDSSHAADSFRYLALGLKSYKSQATSRMFEQMRQEDLHQSDYDPFNI